MTTIPSPRLSFATALRWIARLLSLFSVGFLALHTLSEGFNPSHLAARDLLLFVCFPFGVILGTLLGWRRETLGGALTLLALAAFYGVHYAGSGHFPRGPFFALFASPGLLFLLAGLTATRKAASANP
jgi:hypothetical protein